MIPHSQISRLINQAKNIDPQDPGLSLIYKIFNSKTAYDVALALAAWQGIYHKLPDCPETPIFRSAIAIAQDWATWMAQNPRPHSAALKSTPSGMVTDYHVIPPSDRARAEAAKARLDHGYYRGIRRERSGAEVRRARGMEGYRDCDVGVLARQGPLHKPVRYHISKDEM